MPTIPKPKAQRALKQLLAEAARALRSRLVASAGFSSPDAFRRNLLQALRDHRGFERVVREWHAYSKIGSGTGAKKQRRRSMRLSAKAYKKPLRHAGRPIAARYDAGARKKGRRRG